MLRGVMTFFGHPLFTAMTGIGLAVGLRSKSKVVRVVAPLAGYTAAAFLHMAFNASASLLQGTNLLLIYLFVALPARDRGHRLHRPAGPARRSADPHHGWCDYVRLGWLPEGDPAALSRLRTRGKALWHAIFTGPDVLLATDPAAALGHRAGLPPGRDGARHRRRRPGWSGRSCCCTRSTACADWRWSQPDGRAAYPSFRRRRAVEPHSRRTRHRAFPGRPVWVATIPAPSSRRTRPQHRWGRLLPSTPRSTPPGSHPVSELIGPACTDRWTVQTCDGRTGGAMAGRETGLETALVGLRDALDRGPAADRPAGYGGAALAAADLVTPARRLRAAPARHHRRAAAGRRRRLHRGRQVDAGQLAGRASGHPRPGSSGRPRGHRCSCTTAATRTGSPARGCCPAWPAPRAPATTPGRCSWSPTTASRPGWPSWTPPTSTPWSPTTASSPPSCSPPPTCGCSSPPRPGTPTPCPGTSCCRPPTAARPSRSCWIGSRPGRWRRCRPTSVD